MRAVLIFLSNSMPESAFPKMSNFCISSSITSDCTQSEEDHDMLFKALKKKKKKKRYKVDLQLRCFYLNMLNCTYWHWPYQAKMKIKIMTDRKTTRVRDRWKYRENREIKRLRETIRPWVAGFSWYSTVPIKLGQTHLSLSLCLNYRKGGTHTTWPHTCVHTHTHNCSVNSPEVRTVWELSNSELWLTWKPHETTAEKRGRNHLDDGKRHTSPQVHKTTLHDIQLDTDHSYWWISLIVVEGSLQKAHT